MKRKKQLISFVMAFVMLVGVAAAGIGGIIAEASQTVEKKEGIYSYTVTDSQATITDVSGAAGDVSVPSVLGGYPVTAVGAQSFQFERGLINVIIPASVEIIFESAFNYCDSLVSVRIEDNSNLTSLEEAAFINCFALESFDFGENSKVDYIGESAFCHCRKMETINLPDTLEYIGHTAFEGCISLSEVTIPANVDFMDWGVFLNCKSLERITVEEGNEKYASDDAGIVYNKEMTSVVQYPNGRINAEYTVPLNIVSVGAYAFAGSDYLEEIKFTNPGVVLGEGAFSRCKSISEVTFPEGMTVISDRLFEECHSLVKINFPQSLYKIGNGSFRYCINLKELNLPDNLEILDKLAFEECESLTEIILPGNLSQIGERCFEECYALETVYIPDSVKKLGVKIFYQCFNLENIRLPEGLRTIPDYMFYECRKLENIEIPESVTYISQYAFHDCRKLRTIHFPKNITSYNGTVFTNCMSLESITFGEDSVFRTDENGAVFNSAKTRLFTYPSGKEDKIYTVPGYAESIYSFAFHNVRSTASVVIPESVTEIKKNAFVGGIIADVYFEGNEETWNSFEFSKESANTFDAEIHFNHKPTDHVHEYSQTVMKEPTCIEDGIILLSCDCGKTVEKAYYSTVCDTLCSDCEYKWTVTSLSDCAQTGTKSYACEKCGFEFMNRMIEKEKHSFEKTLKSATDEYAGSLSFRCTECGFEYYDIIPKGAKYIIFRHEAGEDVVYGMPGEKLYVPYNPQKEGYSFRCWVDEYGNSFTSDVIPDKNAVLVPSFNKSVSDNSFGITAQFDDSCFGEMTDGVKLQVENTSGSADKGAVYVSEGVNYHQVVSYKIRTVDENGSKIQPLDGKKVKISIPVPEGYSDGDVFIVIHRFEEGKREVIDAEVVDGYITFETGRFSTFEIYARERLSIISLPDKLTVAYKGQLDLRGLVLEYRCAEYTETVYDVYHIEVLNFDSSEIGEQTVTLMYEGETVEITVDVQYTWWQMLIRIFFFGFLWY